MKRKTATYRLKDNKEYLSVRAKMLNWAKQFNIFLFLDSNDFKDKYSLHECLMAAGSFAEVSGDDGDLLKKLQLLHDEHKDWFFGHICYDYKNNLEKNLESPCSIRIGWPQLHFFCPNVVCHVNKDKTVLTIESLNEEPDDIFRQISIADEEIQMNRKEITFFQRTDKENYLKKIAAIKQHIKDGDCYELNFCCEGFSENEWVKPLDVFRALNTLSPAPFAAFYRNGDKYMICASVERYLRKEGDLVISQPIKGTARRDLDRSKDAEIKVALSKSEKDKAENVMIVDLVRNDLARFCKTGSINVDELCEIYTFPQVHQMISTISGRMTDDSQFTDAIRYTFPMGSMTGAPKIKVMELISRYEDARRELFAGTVGYVTPDGDFDFNVIIRSIFYNDTSQYLSYQAGGAITYDSDPEQEWEEMRLKAWALEKAFI